MPEDRCYLCDSPAEGVKYFYPPLFVGRILCDKCADDYDFLERRADIFFLPAIKGRF